MKKTITIVHDIDFFIKKFEAIPEEDFGKGHLLNHCAYYHCDYDYDYFGKIAKEFTALFGDAPIITVRINDGRDKNYQQPTPKQRILAALYDIKCEAAVKQAQEILNTQTQLQKV